MKVNLRPILPSPPQLVSGGRFCLGTYNKALEKINPLDVSLGWPFPLPRVIKNLRLKEWQHFGLVCDQAYISLALFNAKSVALAQVCIYGRESAQVNFYERMALPWSFQIPETLWKGEATYASKGFRLFMRNRLNEGRYEIEFEIDKSKGNPRAVGKFICFEDPKRSEPIVVCLPLGGNRAMYSHKHITPTEGSLVVGGQTITFNKQVSYSLIDIHKGYYPYVMKWHWATGGGYDNRGKLIGFNFTDNQVRDQDAFNENCVWLDGRLHLLPAVKFKFNRDALYDPWRIQDSQGMVDLHFKPEVVRTVDKNLFVLKSRYRGPFGGFSGKLFTQSGEQIAIENYFGMCEDFYLRA